MLRTLRAFHYYPGYGSTILGQGDSGKYPLLPERSEGKEGWTDERSDGWTGWSFFGPIPAIRGMAIAHLLTERSEGEEGGHF